MSVYSPGWRGGHPGWAGKVQVDLSQLLGRLSTPTFMKCRPWSKSASNLPSSWTIQCLYQLVNNQTDLFFYAGVDGSIVYKTSKLYSDGAGKFAGDQTICCASRRLEQPYLEAWPRPPCITTKHVRRRRWFLSLASPGELAREGAWPARCGHRVDGIGFTGVWQWRHASGH